MYAAAVTASVGALLWTLTDPAFAPSLNSFLNIITLVVLFFVNQHSKKGKSEIQETVDDNRRIIGEVHETVQGIADGKTEDAAERVATAVENATAVAEAAITESRDK